MSGVRKTYHHTQALCHLCNNTVLARIIERDHMVYLEKFCPGHGITEVLISSDSEWYQKSLRYVKPRQFPREHGNSDYRGCPESCGFCQEHQQHTCLPVIEITSNCNLQCPVCLKNFTSAFELDAAEFETILDTLIRREGRVDVLNLSGGEPTLHPDIGTFLRMTLDKGITQTTVSTNGLLFLERPELFDIFRQTGTIAALQFDGFSPEAYTTLRGRDLCDEKMSIIRHFEEYGIRYSLVSTIAREVNDGEISSITDFFFRSKAASLMFQPVALTGHAQSFSVSAKLTIPDIVRKAGESEYAQAGDFNPLPCSHFSCFALAYYFILENGKFLSLKEFLGEEAFLDLIANKTLPGLDAEGFDIMRNRLYDIWSLADAGSLGEQALSRIKRVLQVSQQGALSPKTALSLGLDSMKAIFIHDFMDSTTFDFGRLIKCCNPYPQTDGRFVPICAHNVLFQEKP